MTKLTRPLAISFRRFERRGAGLLLAAVLIHCAGRCGTALAQAPDPSVDPGALRSVHAVAVPGSNIDGQTSWIIEPDVPRIPKIAGLEPKMPPHIEQRLSYAFDLAQRGATYSANTEFQAVIGLCALELDSQTGGTTHRDALQEGWVAMEEADQFGQGQIGWREAADVRNVAASHVTPLLRNAQTPVDSMQAVEVYYKYAEERLTLACKDMPGTSLAFYGLGRTYMIPGTRITHAAAKAALVQRTALVIAPQNVLAGNELGVLLAQHGHLEEAEKMFQQCLAVSPRVETWRNLAAVNARQGDTVGRQSATAAADALAAQTHAQSNKTNVPAAQTADDESQEPKRKPGFMAKFPSLRNPFRR